MTSRLAEYDAQAKNSERLAKKLQAKWRTLPWVWEAGYWRAVAEASSELADAISEAQIKSAEIAATHFPKQLAETGLPEKPEDFDASAFMTATDTLLELPIHTGLSEAFAHRLGKGDAEGRVFSLARLLKNGTQYAQDAGRTATEVLMMDNHSVSRYVRTLRLPSCPGCAILAGTTWKLSEAFQRHPRCDCTNTPVSELEDVSEVALDVSAAIESGQVGHMQKSSSGEWHFRSGLNKAEMESIRQGADPGIIINAKKEMYPVDLFGKRIKATRYGTTVRARRATYQEKGWIKQGQYRRTSVPRMTPHDIFKYAKDRDEVSHMLRYYGYIPQHS